MSRSVTLVLESGKTPDLWYSGQGIGQFADENECRRVADEQKVPRLESFLFQDVGFLEDEVADSVPDENTEDFDRQLGEIRRQPAWHDPTEGLRAVQPLLTHFRERAKVEDDPNDYLAAVVQDLEAYQTILQQAIAENDRFRFED